MLTAQTLSTPITFEEHRKGDWISDMKSRNNRAKSSHSNNDRLRSALAPRLARYIRASNPTRSLRWALPRSSTNSDSLPGKR